VPALQPSTPDEHRRHAAAEVRKQLRQKVQEQFEAIRT
jgi:hypothetical protein